jgi:curved DNA-binding protein CbpA
MQIDYYVVLNVPSNATTAQIVAAYRGLARLYHPDTNKDPNANLRMQVINEAYRILSNPIERAHYDANHALKRPSIQVIYPASQNGDNPWSTYPSDLPPVIPPRSQSLSSTSSQFPSVPQVARTPAKSLRDSPFYRSAINRRRTEPLQRGRGERRFNRIVLGVFILTMILALAVLADQIPSSSAVSFFLMGITLVICINLILDPPYH